MPDSLPQLGPKGDSGAPGPAGPKGDTGEPGAKGEPGIAFLSGNLTPPITPFAAGSEEPVTLERASRLLVHGVLDASSFTCAAAAPASCQGPGPTDRR